MKIWNNAKSKVIEAPQLVIDFLNKIDEICKKYDLSISHEDSFGAFIIEKYSEKNIKWLNDALLNLEN